MIVMMNGERLAQITEILRRGTLERMRARYVAYSNDCDARRECSVYESYIQETQNRTRSGEWIDAVYALRDKTLSPAAQKYFSLDGMLRDMVREADEMVLREFEERQNKARAIDLQLDGFDGTLSDEEIASARAFVRQYYDTPEDIRTLCRRATADGMKKFAARLDQNQKENALRVKAAGLDSRFAELMTVRRDRVYLNAAEKMVEEVRSAPAELLRFCKTATPQAVDRLANQIKIERRYLSCEERIDRLAASKSNTESWCGQVWQTFRELSGSIDQYRNAALLRKLNEEATQIHTGNICAPYLQALSPQSDFETVLRLDRELKTVSERHLLDRGIPSFANKWRARVALAGEQAIRKADEYFEQAEGLYAASRYQNAYDLYVRADRYGNKHAAYKLGVHHLYGRGVSEDRGKAFEYFKKAADNGIVLAMSYLADMSSGREAFYWRELAVKNGFTADRLSLAMMYFNGDGTAVNYAKARELFETLAKENDEMANAHLGKMYAAGLGVSRDEERAVQYYGKAQGVSWAKKEYEVLKAKLEEERLDREINENLARAEAGDPWAQYFIGWCCYTGYHTTTKSYTAARYWFELAAAQGNGKAMSYLGDIYANGEGVEVDWDKAIKYYNDAIQHGEE